MNAYRCPNGDHWHIGHAHAGKRSFSRIIAKQASSHRSSQRQRDMLRVDFIRWVISETYLPDELANRFVVACVQIVDRHATWDEAALRSGWQNKQDLDFWINRLLLLAPPNDSVNSEESRNSRNSAAKLKKLLNQTLMEPDIRLRLSASIALIEAGSSLNDASDAVGFISPQQRGGTTKTLKQRLHTDGAQPVMNFLRWLTAMEQIVYLESQLEYTPIRKDTRKRLGKTFALVKTGMQWSAAATQAGFPSDNARRAAMRRVIIHITTNCAD